MFVNVTSCSSSAAPAIASKSAPEPENLVIPIGTLFSSLPEYMASTPSLLAAFSDRSTTIASTRTWALLISNFEIMFLIELRLSSADEMINEFVFS